MMEELEKIDTSAIEELRKIKQDQEVLKDWLAKLEAKKGEVSEAVYSRVQQDYQGRNAALEEKARPLKDSARSEYAKLRALMERLEKALEVAKLAKEEIEFRHEIGEFVGGDFDERLKQCEQQLAQRDAELAEASQLKARFIEAFHSEDELALPPPPPPKPAAPARSVAAAAVPAPRAAAPSPAPGGTVRMPAEEHPPGAAAAPAKPAAAPPPPRGDATIMIRGPRLVAQADDGGTVDYPLEVQTTTIGRSPDNKIRVQKDAVSRKHAQVVLGPKGYAIVDLRSENGTFVNGKRVTEKALADGDTIEIGTMKFVFREG